MQSIRPFALVLTALALTLTVAVFHSPARAKGNRKGKRKVGAPVVGSDANHAGNPFVQPQDPALAGGGRDQTQKFGDVLVGSRKDDLLIGGLGSDVLLGDKGNDVLIGGVEHFNPDNRDRAFGGKGNDVFIWSPGDGSDFFDGGKGKDTLVFGLLGQVVGPDVVFAVNADQMTAEIAIDPADRLPIVDVAGSPGFCNVIDGSTSAGAAAELAALNLDHLVQFVIRGINQAFLRGDQDTDNGLRVTLSVRNVETLVCTDPAGGVVVAFDLRTSPPTEIGLERVDKRVRAMLREAP